MKENDPETNGEIKIEHDVPIPKPRKDWGWQSDIIKQMNIGDSVVVPRKSVQSIRATAFHRGLKFVTRTVDEQKTRMWRVK